MAAWKTNSVVEQRALFASCLAELCTYTDLLRQAEGWEALVSYIADFQRQVPGGHFITEAFLAHVHERPRSLAKWCMVNADGMKLGEGMS